MNGHVPCERLEWDSEFFGVPIARVLGETLDEAYGKEIDAWCAGEGVQCVYFLSRSDAPESVTWARRLGYELMEVRMEYEWSGNSAAHVAGARLAAPADVPALQAIAGKSFGDSRFYADGRFPPDKCDALYARWIAGSVEGALADATLVLDDGGVPAAFVTCRREGGTGRIGLIGVDERKRGRGLGERMLWAALAWFQKNGMRRVRVTTQGRNLASQRLYQKCGFLTRSVGLYYHKWF